MAEESDDLEGLAEAHFVGENAVRAVEVEGFEPLDAGELVIAEG
eukprot:CAMPEP_0198358072 /NCGR_PEP_ID=MMETSP1450-20131203/129324_1 /TAXON_ID=753684 ORGANISM="Madagascaria erythrocladiodes, Strain CCMP3234" /NCGR_SAMPLE_ID=MMETSP1450 /ASSEMBLY_ACC=CAM_ASM_001115 /LENGTH=43 /DNA_ID= /DNA_START= /DNA_END= /DNA_ORIENTATION=